MATQRQYQMEFLMNARLNGNFSAAFSKAQREFARLGRELQAAGRLQADISAWQKQQKAVEATGAKLQNLRQRYALLQKEIQETAGSTARLEREKLRLEQQLSNTEAALERQRQKLEQTGERLNQADEIVERVLDTLEQRRA